MARTSIPHQAELHAKPESELTRNRNTKRLKMRTIRALAFAAIIALFLLPCVSHAQIVQPFMGIADPQFLSNTGAPLSSGSVYFYAAGTTTSAQTYTDASGTVLNANPIPLNSAGRPTSGGIWLLNISYKIVGCASATDGPVCAGGNTLFTVDNIPGFNGGGGGGSATSPFITASSNPATTGILRLASGDSGPCWRNAANSGNICLHKNVNDLLTWDGGSVVFPEVGAPTASAGFDLLWADNSSHRWKMSNNGGAADNVVGANTTDILQFKTFDTNGGNTLKINGTQVTAMAPASATVVGSGATITINGITCTINSSCNVVAETVFGWGGSGNAFNAGSANQNVCLQTGVSGCVRMNFANPHTITRLAYNLMISPSGCANNAVVGVYDVTSSTLLTSLTITNGQALGWVDSGALSVATTAGHALGVGVTNGAAACTTYPTIGMVNAILQ
jgi:hypothetical protein